MFADLSLNPRRLCNFLFDILLLAFAMCYAVVMLPKANLSDVQLFVTCFVAIGLVYFMRTTAQKWTFKLFDMVMNRFGKVVGWSLWLSCITVFVYLLFNL
ncbi:hypothetical protein OCD85_27225 [Bacillus pacificus]|uniref:hypothetical protein n=1 Tax=Bacillus cereus group TaxID=86661 RepID=UPI0021CD37D2|nr:MULTISPECIES: hypothetical protein [Bacillus cereus group]MCU5364605.1 hypothetical protein [Bacillus pacificus]MCU5402841.1 hypothetical protein [Bacillus pacificus]MDA1963614.1 hypothetical protein [Bacillus cereus group sp. BcHK10]